MGHTVLSPQGRFGPLSETHPGVGQTCPICGTELFAGQFPALIDPIPGSPEDEAKAEAGRAHNVQCDIAHEDCAHPPTISIAARVRHRDEGHVHLDLFVGRTGQTRSNAGRLVLRRQEFAAMVQRHGWVEVE